MIKIVFITNFYNHHQKALADALYSLIGDNYYFIETKQISEERLKMGWGREKRPSYILQNYTDEESKETCQRIVDEADVVMCGSAPYAMLENRLKSGKLTFKYCERPYKRGIPLIKWPFYILRACQCYIRFRNFYVLCASAYTPIDFAKIFSFIGKTYKWGYFPECKKYDDIDTLIDSKRKNSLLWCGRLIDLKHPELAIEVAKRLKAEGYDFTLDIVGNGVLEGKIADMIVNNSLSDCVFMRGAMSPDKAREYMEQSEIYLFTSDRQEGWGAVLNESMNSACAVVADRAIGSAPFLIDNGKNGYLYEDGDIDALYEKTKKLLDNADERKQLARNAYLTMACEWNAENAAKKFLVLCERMLAGEYKPVPFETGVCSKAEILK